MVARPSLGPGSGVIPGPTFFAEYQPAMKGLFDAAAFPLTDVGGTGNAITASLHWDLDAGFVDGMKFTFTAGAANSGAVTLAINGGSAIPVVTADGTALIEDSLSSGLRVLVEFLGGAFRILSGSGSGSGSLRFFWAFTASGTWTKPAGLDDDTMVTVEMWGAGGGGDTDSNASAGGGGGGAYARAAFRAADLPSSVAVTVGAGGVAGATATAGGNTTFGALLTAYGGGPGREGNDSHPVGNGGGGGGGAFQSGAAGSSSGFAPVRFGAAPSPYGGGAGGGRNSDPDTEARNGGMSEYGGGGGGRGGLQPGTGGTSKYGGNGGAGATNGNAASPGDAPGGGGGGGEPGGNGARGEVRVWI